MINSTVAKCHANRMIPSQKRLHEQAALMSAQVPPSFGRHLACLFSLLFCVLWLGFSAHAKTPPSGGPSDFFKIWLNSHQYQ